MNTNATSLTATRRDFVRGAACTAAACAAGLAAAGLAGAPDQAHADGASAAPAASAGKEGIVPGTYTGTGIGRHGAITVEATFGAEGIEAIEVVAHDETEDLSDVALTVIPQAIVKNQSLDVDVVSGATLSSRGVIAAVADAAAQAGASYLEAAPAQYVAQQAMVPGTYTAQAWGKWKEGNIEGARHGAPDPVEPTTVEVTVDATSILSVTVLGNSDTPGFREPALERTPGDIVAQQSLYVDTVTGSTMTSAAITAAVMKCLQQAGADLVGFAKATPKVEGEESYEGDVVIVGAGLTGTAAALEAYERGLKPVIIEKTFRVSGTGACSSGPFAVQDKLGLEIGNTMTVDEAFVLRMEEDKGRTNAPLVYKVIANTGRMVDWLQDRWTAIGDPGFKVSKSNDPMNLMHIYGKGTQKFQDLYDQYILPAGGELLLGTSIEAVDLDETGAVAGVRARRQDGTKVSVKAPAVIMCTGGFGGNPQMMKERLNGVFDNIGLSSNVGTGLLIMEGLGAALSDDIAPGLAEFCGNDVVDYYSGYLKFINQIGFLMLDPAGARFMNEEWCLTESNGIGAAAMRRASWSWVILTQADLDSLQTQGVWGHLTQEYCEQYEMRSRIINPVYTTIGAEVEKAMRYGQAFKADTLEELGEAVGFDQRTFQTAIADYKKVVVDGVDPLFGKDPRLLYPLDEGPFYAIRIISPIDNTYNGARVDTDFQVLDTALKPAHRGLYAAGMDSGGYLTYPYTNFLGASSSYCLTSGMLAADAVAEQLGR